MFIAAVDGGGSKTIAIVADDQGVVLAHGHAACGNHQVVGPEIAVANIDRALQAALRTAQVSQEEIEFVQFSLAGADGPRDEEILWPRLCALGYRRIALCSDAWSSLRMATEDGCGVAVVCGTGTNCVGQNNVGTTVQIGGYGYLFGDEAGGEDLAQWAFHQAVRAYEGRDKPTLLTRLLPDYFQCNSMAELVATATAEAWTKVPAELATVVHRAVEAGDEVAVDKLSAMGDELGRAAAAAISTLGFETSVPVVLTGSILQKGRSPILLRRLYGALAAVKVPTQLRLPRAEPVVGGLMLAADAVGSSVSVPEYDVVGKNGFIVAEEDNPSRPGDFDETNRAMKRGDSQ